MMQQHNDKTLILNIVSPGRPREAQEIIIVFHIDQSSRVRSITIGDGDFNSHLTEEEPDCSAVKEFSSVYRNNLSGAKRAEPIN
jgi:hypothetical protein